MSNKSPVNFSEFDIEFVFVYLLSQKYHGFTSPHAYQVAYFPQDSPGWSVSEEATDSEWPSTSADERSMAQMLPFIAPPTALPLAAHRVSFFLLPARLELGSRRCSPGLEEDDKMTEL